MCLHVDRERMVILCFFDKCTISDLQRNIRKYSAVGNSKERRTGV